MSEWLISLAVLVGFVVFIGVWLAPSIVAMRRNHPHRWLIVGLNMLFGPGLGTLAALTILIAAPDTAGAASEAEPMMSCSECGWPYRQSDYDTAAERLLCTACQSELSPPARS